MAREREKEFASLTLGSRAHNVWQAITPWGNPGGFSLLVPSDKKTDEPETPRRLLGTVCWSVDFDYLIPSCPDTDISHRGPREIL